MPHFGDRLRNPQTQLRLFLIAFLLILLTTACGRAPTVADASGGDIGPRPGKVVPDFDPNDFQIANPQQFPLATAGEETAAPELNVTGSVNPDVSRQVPVPSLATGRVVEIDARLGDTVKKGQLLFKVRSTDVAGAYADYQKSVKNEQLARLQLNRAKILYEDGAIPKSQLETAQTTEDNAAIDVETAIERLRLLGSDPSHPSGIINIYAPVAGVITDQQITDQSGVQALTPPNPFTISDLSHVWVVCDVYENDLPQVHPGEFADVRLNAYPNRVFKARISNILPILDPNLRTAKVRLEMENPGLMRFGMFATATFHGLARETYATVPASAILHLHDREWVYMPLGASSGSGRFRRTEVTAGDMLPGNMQEIRTGVKPGDKVVASALVFQEAVETK